MRRCLKTFALAALVTGLVTGLVACSDDLENLKQGVEGEACNGRDSDCREGLVCNLGVCVDVEGFNYSCADVCQKLAGCSAAGDLETCENQCIAQFEGTCEDLACPWNDDAVSIYSACIVEDLSCSDLTDAQSARDICFATLPYPLDRELRCESFVDAADACSEEANTPLIEFRCSRLARTTDDSSWSRTDACQSRIADGRCAEVEQCLNDVFEINLDLGDGRIDGSDPNPDPVPIGLQR